MDKRTDIISGAERVFEDQGFRGIGVDGILAPSRASTRTLYKHFGSRDGLVVAVLEGRHRDFMGRLADRKESDHPVGHLFEVLEQWMTEHGTRGCMLLRAYSEYAGTNEEIVELVQGQKQEFEREIARRVHGVLGRADAELTTQIWLLFEGATAAASVSDRSVLKSAKRAAAMLLTLAAGNKND
jgi:AcrR family transcriptional regulator